MKMRKSERRRRNIKMRRVDRGRSSLSIARIVLLSTLGVALCGMWGINPPAKAAPLRGPMPTPSKPRRMPVDQLLREQALDQLEAIHLEAERIADPVQRTTLRAKAAGLLWGIDPALARLRFESLRVSIEQQTGGAFPRERAFAELLRYLFPHDATLARLWLNAWLTTVMETVELTGPAEQRDLPQLAQLEGKRPDQQLLNQLAEQLIDADLSLAGEMLTQSFERGYSYPAHASLRQLTKRDATRGARLALELLPRLPSAPLLEALTAAQFLFEYAFPGPQPDGPPAPSNPQVQQAYLQVSRQIFARSLRESPSHFSSDGEQQAWQTNQALLGIILDVFDPGSRSPDEQRLVAILEANLPPALQRFRDGVVIRRANSVSDSPARISGGGSVLDQVGRAIGRGDLLEARKLVDTLEDNAHRSLLDQVLLQATLRDLLSKGEFAAALGPLHSLREPFQRAALLGDLIRVVKGAPEPQFARYLFSLLQEEARELPCTLQKVGTVLPLLSLGEPWDLLDQSIGCINRLGSSSSQLFTLDTFQQPFRDLAGTNWRKSLDTISTIQSPALELLARLAACEGVLSSLPRHPRPARDHSPNR
jgi:hypothetical protein